MKKILLLTAVVTMTTAGNAAAQAQAANPLTNGAKRSYDIIKGYIIRAAEKMPEEHYAFQPTPEVRTFGQLLGHIADANYGICAAAAREKAPMGGFEGATSIEKTMTSKADLQKGLADSFAYCDKAFANMTDAAGTEIIKFFTGEMPRLSVLEFNTHHDFEHYGNMVTYMRIKGLVPPSSERAPAQ